MQNTSPASSFLSRHDFLLRRLHSLSGLIPVGAYMTVHLAVNASILIGPATYQKFVTSIHGLGIFLPVVEWVFIFIPILFHAIYGVFLIQASQPNHNTYRYTNNFRYTLQRATGMIAFAFILWHVFQFHGWIHYDPWLEMAEKFGGAQFRAYNAASTGGRAMQGHIIVPILYAIGVLASVYHLANGIWTMGITWGLWVTPVAQKKANWVCLVFGVLLGIVGLSALAGMMAVDIAEAEDVENRMYEASVEAGMIIPNEHKRSAHERATDVNLDPDDPSAARHDTEAPRDEPLPDEDEE